MEFSEFRQKITEAKSGKSVVFSKRINRIPVEISKVGSKFSLTIDGEHLDDYRSQKEAEKFAISFIKEL